MSYPAIKLDIPNDPAPSSGGRLVTPDGRALPLAGATLRADARGGLARAVLTQRFRNPYEEPLRVSYLLPLPADGAVAGFSFTIGETRIVGEIDRRAAARERFEQALIEGRTAAILDEERSSLFTQEVGNIPPRAEITVEVEIDQPLSWMPEGAWEWRFPTVAGGRYMGGEGRVADAERVVVDVAERGLPARVALELTIGDALAGAVESPSHALVIAGTRASLASGAALDRDLVVRWKVATPDVGVSLEVARPAALSGRRFGLLTLVPPSGQRASVSRDLIFLIDVSGSMHGQPLDQLKRVAAAMIDTLGPNDRVEVIAFGSEPVRFAAEPLAASRDGKRAALKWLRDLRASGATEMRRAVIEALRPLRPGSQRQVILMTDGYIGFEREIIGEVRTNLPEGARLHTVGVGSAVNRTLTQWAARAGSGVEVICGLGEDPERAAARLLARTCLPLVTDLVIEGDGVVAPARLPDLYAGAPSLIALELGEGPITLRGRTGEGVFEERVEVPSVALGEGLASVAALFARERVEDLETERAAHGEDGSIDREIEQLGLTFRIATRLTSWIAVSDAVTVDPDAEKRAVRQPHEVPEGVSIAGMGLRPAQPTAGAGGVMLGAPAMPSAPAPCAPMPQRARYGMQSASASLPEALGQPKRRSSKGSWIVVVMVLLVLAVVGAWVALSLSMPADVPRESTTEAPQRE